MSEVWVYIPGYEGAYMVSNEGRIKGLSRSVSYKSANGKPVSAPLTEKLLKPHLCQGYWKVDLYKNRVREKAYVHILVAQMFVPNPDNKPQVNHKDGNRANSNFENLEWTTQKENVQHARTVLNRTFNSHPPKGKDSPYSKPVLQLDANGNIIKEWAALADIQRECGYKPSHIGNCCRGKHRTMYGYSWKFKSSI